MTKLYAPLEYGEQPCCYHAATKDQKDGIVGGCGAGDGFGDYIVPDKLLGLSIKKACKIHDWMYAYGVTLGEKEFSDRVFLNNMLRLIRDNQSRLKSVNFLRRNFAKSYYLAVKWFGAPAYWDGKNKPEELQ